MIAIESWSRSRSLFAFDPLPDLFFPGRVNIDDEMFIGVARHFALDLAQHGVGRYLTLRIRVAQVDFEATFLYQGMQEKGLVLKGDGQWLFVQVVPSQFVYKELFKVEVAYVMLYMLPICCHLRFSFPSSNQYIPTKWIILNVRLYGFIIEFNFTFVKLIANEGNRIS